MGEYLVKGFAGEDSKSVDVRKVIGKDFEFERVMELSRTSQIKNMMTKSIMVEEFEDI